MSFCAKCGAELSPDSPFCGSCGAPVAGAEAAPAQAAPPPPPPSAAAPPPPPAAGSPAYGPPAAPAGPAFQPPKSGGGGAKIAIFVLIGLLVIGAVVGVVLWLTLGGDDDNGGSGGGGSATSGPEKVVDTFLKAMEEKDAEMLLGTFAPSALEELEDEMGGYYGDLEELFGDILFSSYESMEFNGVKYDTEIDGDTATVKIVAGSVTIVDEYGDKSTEDIEDSETSTELELVKEDGNWYIDPNSM